MQTIVHRLLHILIALDQLIYVLVTLGRASPRETLSAAAYRGELQGRIAGRIFRPIIDILFSPLEKQHCYWSWKNEQDGKHDPKEKF